MSQSALPVAVPAGTRALRPVLPRGPSAASGPGDAAGAPIAGGTWESLPQMTSADLHRGDLTGLRLGSLRLGRRLGAGGMGTVFAAVHQTLGRTVAVKFIAPHAGQHPDAVARFRQEIASLGRLQHPHILCALDAGTCQGLDYLVTEYVDGLDLYQHVRNSGPLPVREAAELIGQAAAALAWAHSAGFVHRDVKPSNLIRDVHGNVRLVDFGLVRGRIGTADLTSDGQLLGTVDFLAPEQAADGRCAGPSSDIYSLGCTFVYLLTGEPPFSGPQFGSFAAKIHAHLFQEPEALSRADSRIPGPVKSILRRMVAKQPADRFASADEVVTALADLQKAADAGTTGTGVRNMPARLTHQQRPVGYWNGRRTARNAAVCGVAACLAGMVWWGYGLYAGSGTSISVDTMTAAVDVQKPDAASASPADSPDSSVAATDEAAASDAGAGGQSSMIDAPESAAALRRTSLPIGKQIPTVRPGMLSGTRRFEESGSQAVQTEEIRP